MKCVLFGALTPQSTSFTASWGAALLALGILIPAIIGMFLAREKFLWRLGMFLAFCGVVGGVETWWFAVRQPAIAPALAVQQLNGSDAAAAQLRAFNETSYAVHAGAMLLVAFSALVCFAPCARIVLTKMKTRAANFAVLATAGALLVACAGCKPYDRPEYVEIDTSETGFLIPLEGDSGAQAKFQSEDYLRERKVAAKRVQILHRWSQEGRLEASGQWIPTVRLIKVNRSPVTREWTTQALPAAGTAARKDRAIWIESADSVGFSMGFACTAFIAEDDAARFLYWYPSGSLADMMDNEIRARIQQVAAEVAAKYSLDLLRAKKQEIVDAVKKDVTAFFQNRGVTVTTIGMFGGMTYENPEIQRAIDQTFIAQQLKVVAEAKFEAQQKENERIELESDSVAERARREARGLADARKTQAEAESEAVRKMNQALNEASQSPLLLQLKAIEVEKARIEKWDGRYPTWYVGSSDAKAPNLLVSVPAPAGNSH
jgi:hypothetical protein